MSGTNDPSALAVAPDPRPSVVLLTRVQPTSLHLAKQLAGSSTLCLAAVIAESREHGQWHLLRGKYRRAMRGNPFTFLAFLASLPYLVWHDRRSSRRLRRALWVDDTPTLPPGIPAHMVVSHNSPEAAALLTSLAPDFIAVFGTRILKPEIFGLARLATLNWHLGITPEYRGAKSEFWALYRGEPHMVGLTLHIVDKGIDTGPVLHQEYTTVGPQDDEVTLRARAVRACVPMLDFVVARWLAGKPPRVDTAGRASRNFSTPTMLQYMRLHRRLRQQRRSMAG